MQLLNTLVGDLRFYLYPFLRHHTFGLQTVGSQRTQTMVRDLTLIFQSIFAFYMYTCSCFIVQIDVAISVCVCGCESEDAHSCVCLCVLVCVWCFMHTCCLGNVGESLLYNFGSRGFMKTLAVVERLISQRSFYDSAIPYWFRNFRLAVMGKWNTKLGGSRSLKYFLQRWKKEFSFWGIGYDIDPAFFF